MRTANLKIQDHTLDRLKVLSAQLDRSMESTVDFLLDHHDEVLEREFNQALDAYNSQRIDDARQSMVRMKKRFQKQSISHRKGIEK